MDGVDASGTCKDAERFESGLCASEKAAAG